ncbi:AsmA-like C-terminal domain-containing protein [Acidocella sp.]|uniref:YhdP family protein n=1 Tax=Acidocella sp. TaxID=50710 RepID=UPI003D00283F
MKPRRGQAAWIVIEALHQLGRIAILLILLALGLFGLLAFRLSQGPLDIPVLASRLATQLTGEGVNVHVAKAELAWAGYHKGGAVPFVLRLGGIKVRTDSGGALADIPTANLVMPAADLFGGRAPVQLTGEGATFPGGNVPVSWSADLWPGAGFTLSSGDMHVSIGKGDVGVNPNSVALEQASFVLRVARGGGVTVSDGMAQLQRRGASAPRLTFSFHAHREGLWLGRLDVTLDEVRAQDLAAFWPPAAMPETRQWVTENITAGTARGAHFTFDMAANGDLSHFRVVNAHGQFDGDDLTLDWLTGATPLVHMNGQFVMPGMDTAVITATSGEAGGVKLNHGSLVITDMTAKDQFGDLKLDLSGKVRDVLAILGAPPLDLLDSTPPEVRRATGMAHGVLDATIPFKKDLHKEEVALTVRADITDVRMDTLIPGIGFTNGQVALTTDGHTLHASARTDFAGEPATLTVDQTFDHGGNEVLQLHGIAGRRLWHVFGLDTPSNVSSAAQGTAPFDFSLSGPPGGVQQAVLTIDLTPAGLALPVLGWQKSPGEAGRVMSRFTLRDGALDMIQTLTVNAPDFTLRAHGAGARFVLDAAHIGRTEASGTLVPPAAPGEPWGLNLSGAVLDVRAKEQGSALGRASRAAVAPAGEPAAAGLPWRARLAFGKFYLAKSPAPPLRDVTLGAAGRGESLSTASGKARGLTLSVTSPPDGRHDLTLQGEDAGELLRALGAYDGMRGGGLDLTAAFGGGAARGTLKLTDARLVKAPGFTKVLQAATLYGVAEAVSGPGLLIDHALVPFTLNGDILELHGADAYSESLGFTASGTVNTRAGTCDLDTTIVPAYAINSLPGKIPLLGRLFSAEKGGGLFAVRAHVQGDLDSPSVRVNPLSALTPGVLRGIFGLGEQPPKASSPSRN